MLVRTFSYGMAAFFGLLFSLVATAAVSDGLDSEGSGSPWSGPYAGVNLGYGWSDADWVLDGNGWWGLAAGPNNASLSPDGAFLGAHAGFGQTYQNNLYLGVEASFNVSQMDESIPSPAFPGIDTWNVSIDYFWDISGRLGYVQDRYLVYATAGVAGAEVKTFATPPLDPTSESHLGYSRGIGGEYMYFENYSIGLEYKYIDFGSSHHNFNPGCGPCGPGDGRNIDVSSHILTLRTSFHF